MSKHNYSQYSNKKNNTKVAVSETEVEVKTADTLGHPDPVGELGVPGVEGVPEVKMVVEHRETAAVANVEPETVKTAEPEILPNIIKGIVTGCSRLNVRAYPSLDAEVVCILDVMSELEINDDKSTYDWLCVCTATGVEGYCMKKFVETHL